MLDSVRVIPQITFLIIVVLLPEFPCPLLGPADAQPILVIHDLKHLRIGGWPKRSLRIDQMMIFLHPAECAGTLRPSVAYRVGHREQVNLMIAPALDLVEPLLQNPHTTYIERSYASGMLMPQLGRRGRFAWCPHFLIITLGVQPWQVKRFYPASTTTEPLAIFADA
jgi:hypothetical protein